MSAALSTGEPVKWCQVGIWLCLSWPSRGLHGLWLREHGSEGRSLGAMGPCDWECRSGSATSRTLKLHSLKRRLNPCPRDRGSYIHPGCQLPEDSQRTTLLPCSFINNGVGQLGLKAALRWRQTSLIHLISHHMYTGRRKTVTTPWTMHSWKHGVRSTMGDMIAHLSLSPHVLSPISSTGSP